MIHVHAHSSRLIHLNIGVSFVLNSFAGNLTLFVFRSLVADLQLVSLDQRFRFGNASRNRAVNIVGVADNFLTASEPMSNLTSVGNTTNFTHHFVPLKNTRSLCSHPNGYLMAKHTGILEHISVPSLLFDSSITDVGEAHKQTMAVDELLLSHNCQQSGAYFTNSGDLAFCGGDCPTTGGVVTNISLRTGEAEFMARGLAA